MKAWNKIYISFMLLCLQIFCVTSAKSTEQKTSITLKIQVQGLVANKGQVIASLFTSEQNYLETPVHKQTVKVGNENSLEVTYSSLALGIYSVGIVYDQNNDGKLDTNFIGIPKEPVGFSNNAKGSFGPPSFKQTSIMLEHDKRITIELITVN